MPESLDSLLQRVTMQQQQIATARPLPNATLRSLLEDFLIRFAHDTTALEGNTLTLHETQVVFEHGITIGGETLREHLEVANIATAWHALEHGVQSAVPLTETVITHLHRLTMQGILDDDAGHYRTTVPVFIRGSRHVPPNPLRVPDAMADFVQRFAHRPESLHPIIFAAQAHIQLAAIHPFVDGNGRVSSLLVNGWLLRDGYPPASYPATSRAEYLTTLERAKITEDIDPFVHVTAEAVDWMQQRYLLAIRQTLDSGLPRSGPQL
jgi:Fic family protein